MSVVVPEGRVVLAAVSAGVAVGAAAGLIVKPTPRLASRVRPYTVIARSKLGRSADVAAAAEGQPWVSGTTMRRLFGPPVLALAERLSRLLDARSDEGLRLQLRRAGFGRLTPEEYRVRQLGFTAVGTAGGAVLGLAIGGSAALVLILAALGLVIGATRWRSRLDKATALRRGRMRIELYTVNQLLAMQLKTGGGPIQAVQRVVDRGSGAVVEELSEVLRLIAGGMPAADAFSRAADLTAEPQAARTYALLAAGSERGTDVATALLAFSEDIRDDRREDLKRAATRRRATMLVPIIALLAPVMLILILAPIPSIVFGFR
ncbi:MAG TPA: type II secretion system F family protein [Actinomycetota bacterium]|nr:type II secretion system F family protein [Actinomycetota bacterium]